MDDWQQVSDPLAPLLEKLERKMKANQCQISSISTEKPQSARRRSPRVKNVWSACERHSLD